MNLSQRLGCTNWCREAARSVVMSEKRTRISSGSKLRAILAGAASVLRLDDAAYVNRYLREKERGFDADADALRGDQRAIAGDFDRAKHVAG